MISQISGARPVTFQSRTKELAEFNEHYIEMMPAAEKVYDTQKRSKSTLAILGGGMVTAPLIGIGMSKLVSPTGPIIRLAEKVGTNTAGFDKWIQSFDLPNKVDQILEPLKKPFRTESVKLFKEGYKTNSLVNITKEALAKAAPGSKEALAAQATLDTLAKVNNTGILGRTVGKTGVFLKNNLTGVTGVLNGLFAALTVNSVVQAKKGEKFSTLMEDVLGTWIGSMGGYKLFESILKGMDKVSKAGTKPGILMDVAKLVNKIPYKQFVVPLIGTMVLSNLLQKLSHKLFGRPTKEQDVIRSKDDLQTWMDRREELAKY